MFLAFSKQWIFNELMPLSMNIRTVMRSRMKIKVISSFTSGEFSYA